MRRLQAAQKGPWPQGLANLADEERLCGPAVSRCRQIPREERVLVSLDVSLAHVQGGIADLPEYTTEVPTLQNQRLPQGKSAGSTSFYQGLRGFAISLHLDKKSHQEQNVFDSIYGPSEYRHDMHHSHSSLYAGAQAFSARNLSGSALACRGHDTRVPPD